MSHPQPKSGNAAREAIVKDTDKQLRSAAVGQLFLGRNLIQWEEAGGTIDELDDQLRSRGVRLPSAGRRSVMRGVWQAWVEKAGLDPDVGHHMADPLNPQKSITISLASVPVDKLYLLKDEVNPRNRGDMLKLAFFSTEKELKERKRGEVSESETGKVEETPTESEFKSLALPTDVYRAFVKLQHRIHETQGDGDITRVQVFEFMLGQFTEIGDAALDFLWRQAHGEVTREEVEAAQAQAFDVE